MKIACKWFLFLPPACHVMVARFACKTFGLLSARHTLTQTHTLWLCAKTAKAKSLPRTWTWKSRLPELLTANFRIFFSAFCVGVDDDDDDCSWSCAHTHMQTHTLINYTNSVCRGNSCSQPAAA